jgi:hypothetical protein
MSSATQKNTGHLRTVTQIALLCAVAAGSALGCVSSSSDNKGTGGTPVATGGTLLGAGGAAGSGSLGTGGSAPVGTAGSTGTLPVATACPVPTTPLITDFAYTAVDAGVVAPTEVSFGDFKTTLSGGTYIYPDSAAAAQPALTSDITAGNWHISGTVGTYSGLGLYLNGCALLDASAFKGIKMTISGSVPAPNTLNLSVGTAADTISTAWYTKYTVPPATVTPTFGTCSPPTSNQYDQSCSAPSKVIPVTATATTVTILWADLTGGKPQASVDPKSLTGLSFYFTWNGSSSTAYPVDIVIDDLSFVAP